MTMKKQMGGGDVGSGLFTIRNKKHDTGRKNLMAQTLTITKKH